MTQQHPTPAMQLAGGAVELDYTGVEAKEGTVGWLTAARVWIAMETAREQQGWRPIETAPKDMAARLYRVNNFVVQGFVDATDILCVQSDAAPWRKMKAKPTHWMPLPPAPEAA